MFLGGMLGVKEKPTQCFTNMAPQSGGGEAAIVIPEENQVSKKLLK